jgi:hypothetical protein
MTEEIIEYEKPAMTKIIEYEKPVQCSLHILKNGTSIAEILDKRGRPTIRKIHSMLMSNHLELSA